MTTDAKFWNQIADKYAAKPVANVPAFERKKSITREQLRADSKVLEIGCGTGSLALEMARHAGHIEALDISSEMLRIARYKQQSQGVTNITFRQGTLDEAAYPAAHFDAVWAYSVMHLVPDRRATLHKIFALLRPGGCFISSTVCLGDSWVPYGALITLARWVGKAPPVYTLSRQTLFGELLRVGFVDTEEINVGAEKTTAFVVTKKPAR